ncbi:MAG: IS30 family transposase [Acidimicrobiales bacterium]
MLGDIEPISARPPEAADRAIPGHWEGDLIMGAFNRSAIVTVVERRSRFLLLGELPDGHGAQAVYECLLGVCGDLPDVVRRSLTWDQGREMADWVDLELAADMEVYFCDPHSPWQRPSNEHMNGLLRQYFPKGTRPQQCQPGSITGRRCRNEWTAPEGPRLADSGGGVC